MVSSNQNRNTALRDVLISKATQTIAKTGRDSLRAKDIAAQAGCAVGAIYNVFSDINELVLAVNLRTLEGVNQTMRTASLGVDASPADQIMAISTAMQAFARRHENLWRAAFDLPTTGSVEPIQAKTAEMLISSLREPVERLRPGLGARDVSNLSHALLYAILGNIAHAQARSSHAMQDNSIDRMLVLLLGMLKR